MNELTSGDFTEAAEPFALFEQWFAEAGQSEPNDPNAMALATVDADGLPDVRMVLLKGWDERGLVFYTNEESAKGRGDGSLAEGVRVVSLEVAAPANPAARIDGFRQRRRGRRLFQKPGRATAASALLGSISNRGRWKAASPSKKPSPAMSRNSASAKFRARPIGGDIA